MFLGHFAVGFAAKRAAPKTSLGTLLAAALLLDLLWPIFLLVGWEEVRVAPGDTAFTPLEFVRYPISHSLAMSVVWAALFAVIYFWRTRYRTGAVVVALLVVSHWALDALAHRPDLPLWPGGSLRAGLGLWNSVGGTLVVEITMFVAGVWLYLRTTRSRDRVGSCALFALLSLLSLMYAGSVLGPPPPSANAVAAVDLAGWLMPFWAAWVDRHRQLSAQATPSPLR